MKNHSFLPRLSALLLATVLSVTMVSPALAASKTVTPKNWMKQVDGDLSLAQFTIPGSHDSCTDDCAIGRDQNYNIKMQLNMGIRFLDIRLKLANDTFNCYHGFVYCFKSFKSVMKDVAAFLKAHPTECIIMSIKNEGDESAEFEARLVDQWICSGQYADLFYTEDAIPTLSEVRGRIVLMRRYNTYDSQLTCGINARNGWADNAVFTISGSGSGYSLQVQDIYQFDTYGLTFGSETYAYFDQFDQQMQQSHADNDPDSLYLNFASACNRIGCGTLSCATVVNYNIYSAFKNDTIRNHGIVIMDYVNSALVKTVYECNFREVLARE